MWPFSRRVERKENPVGGAISAWTVGRPVWTERRFDQLAEESYLRNAVAFKCVKLIATGAATVPWLLEDAKGKQIEKHDLLNLLNRPSPMTGGHALFEAYYAYLLLAGNTYLVAPQIANGRRPPKELWNLRPDRMKVVAGPYGLPQGYEYDANGQVRRFAADPMTGMGEVLHVKEFHPLNDWYGLGRVEAAAYGIDRHNAASAHNKALLDNGARPSGALVFQPVKEAGGAEKSAPKEVIDEARRDLDENHGGPRNAGKPMVFGGNVDWKEMGLSPRDMDFAVSKQDAARDICYAFGVPDILIVPGQSTYNNVSEAKLDLWEQTILPMIDHTVDALNAWLAPSFGEGLKLSIDLDEIPALEPRRLSKRTSVLGLYDKGLIDDTEAREALQYGPRLPGAIKLQRGDGQTIAALVTAAQADTAMLEPLYRYLVSMGLLDGVKTSMDEFILSWDGSTSSDPSLADAMAALGQDPNATPAGKSMMVERTLYVSRPLLNGAEFIAWAKGQGFTSVIAPADLHVTVAFSRAEVDWSQLEPDNETLAVNSTVDRSVGALGDKGAVVQHFASSALTARWQKFRDAGASWDFPGYQPHVSITYDGTSVDLSKVKPFMGQLIFGPETFAEVNTDWQAGVVEE